MSTGKQQRIWELDALRGFMILCVVIAHSLFYGAYVAGLFDLPPLIAFVINYGGALFVLLSGLCSTLGSRDVQRGLVVFTGGMILTLGSWLAVSWGILESDMIIRFGVLHLLGVAMLLAPVLKRLPTWELAIFGLELVLVGYWLSDHPVFTESHLLFPLGILYPGFTSGDYFPMAPHLGWFALGIVLGRLLYPKKQTLLPGVPQENPFVRFFCFCGRNSLYIFVLHLPVVGGVMMLLTLALHPA